MTAPLRAKKKKKNAVTRHILRAAAPQAIV
jgi:hypothetical protein